MDRLHELEVLVAVADAGSFAKAGARLRLSPPAVTRAVSALEKRIGTRVFNRTTRSLTITDAGQRFIERARRILADLEAAQREAAGEAATPRGRLAVTASVTFGRSVLAPVMCAFLDCHPQVTASLLLLDRVVNLVEEGIDVAVRIGQLPDSTLVATRIGAVRRLMVASPDYLARHGAPGSPQELRTHSVIAFTGLMPGRELRFGTGAGRTGVGLAPRLEVNDALAALEAAEAGHGITTALSYMVSERIRAGTLVTVLGRHAPPAQPIHLVYPRTRMVAPPLRAFLDFAAPQLRSALASLGPEPGSVRGS